MKVNHKPVPLKREDIPHTMKLMATKNGLTTLELAVASTLIARKAIENIKVI